MSDIFREIDEEVRRDQFVKLWRSYGKYVAAVAIVVVVAAVGTIAWREYKTGQRLAEGEAFAEAVTLLDAGRRDEAAAKFAALAEDASAGYASLAGLRAAQALAAAGNRDGAVAAYDRLAADSGADPMVRDLARLNAVIMMLDTGAADELRHRLAPLLDAASPWRDSARELSGVLALREGDAEAARAIFEELASDTAAASGVRARAAEFFAALGGGATTAE